MVLVQIEPLFAPEPGIFKSLYKLYGYNKKPYLPDKKLVFKEAEFYGTGLPCRSAQLPFRPNQHPLRRLKGKRVPRGMGRCRTA